MVMDVMMVMVVGSRSGNDVMIVIVVGSRSGNDVMMVAVMGAVRPVTWMAVVFCDGGSCHRIFFLLYLFFVCFSSH